MKNNDTLDRGTAIALMKMISGAVDVAGAKKARDDAEAAQEAAEAAKEEAEAAQTAAEAAADLAAERSFAVSISGTRLVFTSTAE